MSQLLLLDLGNSRLKWAIVAEATQSIVTQNSIDNANFSEAALSQQFRFATADSFISRVYLSAVGQHTLAQRLAAYCQTTFNLSLTELQTLPSLQLDATNLQLINAYADPDQLGVDRWLNMLAAYQMHQSAVMVVSIGTATTIDIVDASGRHLGGYILPGIEMMQSALQNATADKNISVGQLTLEDINLASNTQNATAKGVLLTQVASIEKIYQQYAKHKLQLVMTGGGIKAIQTFITMPYQLECDLVFKGMLLQINALND